jgi:glycosyltransferase involved in cell wall biosynthesis
MRIDQWVPALHWGDAIGDATRLMRDAFRRWGHESEIYALEIDTALASEGRPFSEFRAGSPSDVVILHYALVSPLTQALAKHRGRRVLLHHSVTPPEFFAGLDDELARLCRLGQQELASLASHVDLALAVSEFDRRELVAAGFARTGVVPLLLDFARFRQPPQPVLSRLLDDGMVNLLFVGRISPNKRPDDLIRVASYWKRCIGADLRLLLVGKLPRRRAYFDALQRLFYGNGLTPAEVVFTGHVTHDELLAYYHSARVFLSLSEHEGFGAPLIEAMLMDVPVLAYCAGAVGETLGDAGVQFSHRRIDEIAEMAERLARDPSLRAGVLASQRRRLSAFEPAAVEVRLRAALEEVLR